MTIIIVKSPSPVRHLGHPWTVALQASLSMGILQARILEWVAMPSSRGSSQPRIELTFLASPALAGGFLPIANYFNRGPRRREGCRKRKLPRRIKLTQAPLRGLGRPLSAFDPAARATFPAAGAGRGSRRRGPGGGEGGSAGAPAGRGRQRLGCAPLGSAGRAGPRAPQPPPHPPPAGPRDPPRSLRADSLSTRDGGWRTPGIPP